MKRVLITGASSGIGEQLAYKYAAKGYDLLLVARRNDKLFALKNELEKKYKVEVDYYGVDIVNSPKSVYDYCRLHELKIDILINNAGYGDYGEFINSDLQKDLGIIELNNKALVSLTYYFIKDMKENGGGQILNVASVASFMPGPYMAVYYASKAFVLSFSLALRQELKKYHIKVSALCPAPTKSDFWVVANGQTTSVYQNVFARTTENAAETGVNILDKNKAYSIDGLAYKLAIFFIRILPVSFASKLIGYLQKKTKNKVE